ncbi:MAG: Ni/Fe-hydrogenase cytochrome b subunit [Bryobacteraceae bacterium]|nr:Ni/Fe-hydrogenase cytochrome b subunit [Bryobacteraceae bacterium]HAX42705.1 Ni/Fe-hydrogenase cytochrome b subunit [Bryobacterales bacterium]HRJ20172.1 Ni/Fe-hydrogenase cytochrome b subunit [Bryobacteraceae bacterium]
MSRFMPRTFWQWVFAALMVAGLYATYIRIFYGLGGATNLSDQFPWGIWVGFDILCGVGLAAGGFTLAAIVHIFHLEEFKPVVRPAILTAFLGYVLVVVALMFDLGQPHRVWHPIIMWNPRSVMFEVGWCVTLYTTVLFLEFLPVILEKLGLQRPRRVLKGVMLPIIIMGVILSTLHQSSLGSLYLIANGKLNTLWYTPLLPVLFYVSAIGVGLAMTIFESWHSSKAFGRELEWPLIQKLSRVLAVVIACYLTMRFLDLNHRGAWAALEDPGWESRLFVLEIMLMAVPMLLLFRERTRQNPHTMYAAVTMFLFGFLVNRLNIAVTGMERASGVTYIPKWTEVVITLAIVAAGFAIFKLAAKYLPLFEPMHDSESGDPEGAPDKLQPAATPGD